MPFGPTLGSTSFNLSRSPADDPARTGQQVGGTEGLFARSPLDDPARTGQQVGGTEELFFRPTVDIGPRRGQQVGGTEELFARSPLDIPFISEPLFSVDGASVLPASLSFTRTARNGELDPTTMLLIGGLALALWFALR